MKMRALIALLAVVAMSVVNAEEEKSGLEVAAGVGKFFYNNPLLDNSTMTVFNLGYQFNNNWQVDLMHGNPDTKLNPSYADMDVDWTTVRAMYLFDGGASSTPYLSAGAFDMDVYGSEVDAIVGIGFKIITDDNLLIRIEGNYQAGEKDASILAMVGYSFGASTPKVVEPKDGDMDGVMDNVDVCPKTPVGKPVDERGCMIVDKDTDGDGVVDRLDQCPNTPQGALVDSNGCQKVLEKEVSVDLKINFDTNSAVVKASYDSELARVAKFMKEYASTNVIIEGHTDSVGRADYNQSLSERRASGVADALAERFAIDASRISAKGFGEDRPIASNDTAEGRESNRRVVAVISQQVKEKQWQ